LFRSLVKLGLRSAQHLALVVMVILLFGLKALALDFYAVLKTELTAIQTSIILNPCLLIHRFVFTSLIQIDAL